MPIIKNILRRGQAKFQNLEQVDVLQEETGNLIGGGLASRFFNIRKFPSPLPVGKSYFLIEGSDLLRPDVELKTEILDRNNTPIYHFPLHRRPGERETKITMETYSNVESGIGRLIVLAELNPDRFNVPPDYRGIYNVRFVGTIEINAQIPNTQPIEFFRRPYVNVSEIIRPNLDLSTTTETTFTSISGRASYNGGNFSTVRTPRDPDEVVNADGTPKV